MSARITIERVLRDDDDMSGQTIRRWCIVAEGDFLIVRDNADRGVGFISLRRSDVDTLIADLRKAVGGDSSSRKRAWDTRREKYGPNGHKGSYKR